MKRVVLLGLMLFLPAGLAVAGTCKPACKQVYFNTLLALCPVCSRDVINARTACFDAVPMDFEDCATTCLPFPGRCTLTMECLGACRIARSKQQWRCQRRFQNSPEPSGRVRHAITGMALMIVRKSASDCLCPSEVFSNKCCLR